MLTNKPIITIIYYYYFSNNCNDISYYSILTPSIENIIVFPLYPSHLAFILIPRLMDIILMVQP